MGYMETSINGLTSTTFTLIQYASKSKPSADSTGLPILNSNQTSVISEKPGVHRHIPGKCNNRTQLIKPI
jgi:hypothetical protein